MLRIFASLSLLALAACGGPAQTAPPTNTPPPPPTPTEPDAERPEPEPEPEPDGEILASLERGACFGFCPVYQVTIYEDGRVVWRGERFVKAVGTETAELSPDQLAELRQAFEDAGWGSFAERYDRREITDQPSATVRYGDKTVYHYFGDRTAPPELKTLEERIDEIVGTDRWIGTDEERRENR